MKQDDIEKIGYSVIAIVIYAILRTIAHRIIKQTGLKNDYYVSRTVYMLKFFNFLLNTLLIVSLLAIWNLKADSFLPYFASFFTVAGVALFAQWSLLSNITSSVILFFSFPFKIGSKVRIMDDKNSVEGIVYDITFFVVQIKTADGSMVSYPNNTAIQKGIMAFPDEDETQKADPTEPAS